LSPEYLSLLGDIFLIVGFALVTDIPAIAFIVPSAFLSFVMNVVIYNIFPYLGLPFFTWTEFKTLFGEAETDVEQAANKIEGK